MAFNEEFMRDALNEAKKALQNGEAPIGAVVVYKNEIIGLGANTREAEQKISGHAEINAIEAALYPADTDYYFFLTDSDMNFHYAVTWKEHSKNVDLYYNK